MKLASIAICTVFFIIVLIICHHNTIRMLEKNRVEHTKTLKHVQKDIDILYEKIRRS